MQDFILDRVEKCRDTSLLLRRQNRRNIILEREERERELLRERLAKEEIERKGRELMEKQNIVTKTAFQMTPIDCFEEDLGNFMFDYSEQLTPVLRSHFSYTIPLLKLEMEGYLSQSFFGVRGGSLE